MTPTKIIQRLLEIRAEKAELNKQLAELNKEYDRLDAVLIKRLQDRDMQSIRLKDGPLFSLVQHTVPKLTNAPRFFRYVRKERAEDLLMQQVNKTAWRERLDSGVLVPGTAKVTFIKSSLRKS